MFLQDKLGTIPAVHAVGPAAKVVVDVILRLRREERAGEPRRDARPSTSSKLQPGVPPVAHLAARRSQPALGAIPGRPVAGKGPGAGTPQLPGIDEALPWDCRRARCTAVPWAVHGDRRSASFLEEQMRAISIARRVRQKGSKDTP